MARLAILALMLVAVVAIAEATTITTTVIEESLDQNPQGRRQSQHGMCSEQLQGKGFTHCLNYFTQGGRSSSRRGRVYLNPMIPHLQECCDQLESVDEDCRCAAIQRVLQRTQQERQMYRGQDMEEMMRAAMELPRMCRWNEPQQCQMRAVFV